MWNSWGWRWGSMARRGKLGPAQGRDGPPQQDGAIGGQQARQCPEQEDLPLPLGPSRATS